MSEMSVTNADGTTTRLLYMDEIARRAGVKPESIRAYNAAGRKARRSRRGALGDMPAYAKRVRRTVERNDGVRVVVNTPVWREDEITHWLANRRGPGGRIKAAPPQPPQAEAC